VERLAEGEGAFTTQSPLSCSRTAGAVVIAVDECGSFVGHALLLGGYLDDGDVVSTVSLVDLASGVCTLQPNLLHARCRFAAERLPDARIVCAGGFGSDGTELSSAEAWGPLTHESVDAAWTWRQLPAMSVTRNGCGDVC
jgi:hypothetical protein